VTRIPLSTHWGEREGPGAERWEGEVGMRERLWNPPPHLTSPPPRAERDVPATPLRQI